MAYVIVPGVGGSDERHWQTRWEQEWGTDAVRITPRSWDEPERDDWVDAVGRAVRSIGVTPGDVVMVAHSLGCWAAAEWLGHADAAPVRALLLVAPPDPTTAVFAEAAGPTFAHLEARPLAPRSVVVASTDDPYCSIAEAERLAAHWGSDLRVLAGRGHINSASGLGDWDEGREVLDALLRG